MLLEIREEVQAELREDLSALKPEEAAVLAFLRQRLAQAAEQQRKAA